MKWPKTAEYVAINSVTNNKGRHVLISETENPMAEIQEAENVENESQRQIKSSNRSEY